MASLRFCLPLFPDAMRQTHAADRRCWRSIGILYFALQALVAEDFKRLLAYVSLSHMGVIVLGDLRAQRAGHRGRHRADGQPRHHHRGAVPDRWLLSRRARDAAAGRLWRAGDAAALAGDGLPVAALAALGLPGLNSFAGEFLAFLGAFHANVVFGALGTLVVVPAAWYMLRFFQGVMEGAKPELGRWPKRWVARAASWPICAGKSGWR